MSTSTTSNIGDLVRPLNPATFDPSSSSTANHELDLTSDESKAPPRSLSANDRIALQALLGVLRNGRLAVKSHDKKLALAGYWQILHALTYLSGFLDSKGLADPIPVGSGFSSIAPIEQSDDKRDNLQKIEDLLVQLVSQVDTRSVIGAVLGAIAVGVGGYLIKDGCEDVKGGIKKILDGDF